MSQAIESVRQARRNISGAAIRTPLVRLNVPDAPAQIYLKLENLQPIGSFKIRGAATAIAHRSP
ncbi:MAG TPA: pyridoxal-phosphate dependent enzyme, partial [Rudaea sp.]|nr:pyridoxal-phosphate dependent enzyme [Rudaea sp.]